MFKRITTTLLLTTATVTLSACGSNDDDNNASTSASQSHVIAFNGEPTTAFRTFSTDEPSESLSLTVNLQEMVENFATEAGQLSGTLKVADTTAGLSDNQKLVINNSERTLHGIAPQAFEVQQNSKSTTKEGQHTVTVALTSGDKTTTRSLQYGVLSKFPSDQVRETAISASGQYMMMGDFSAVYTSNDYGQTWVKLEKIEEEAGPLEISSDGKYMVVTAINKLLLLSTDYGANWTKPVDEKTDAPSVVSISADDGKYILLGDFQKFHISSDYGTSFQTRPGLTR